jgi:hypothetical protein
MEVPVITTELLEKAPVAQRHELFVQGRVSEPVGLIRKNPQN